MALWRCCACCSEGLCCCRRCTSVRVITCCLAAASPAAHTGLAGDRRHHADCARADRHARVHSKCGGLQERAVQVGGPLQLLGRGGKGTLKACCRCCWLHMRDDAHEEPWAAARVPIRWVRGIPRHCTCCAWWWQPTCGLRVRHPPMRCSRGACIELNTCHNPNLASERERFQVG